MVCRTGIGGKPFYGCSRWPDCTGVHGAHPDGRPLGIPANKATRQARMEAHKYFDRLWLPEPGYKPRMTRRSAYQWLQRTLKLPDHEAHFARFSLAQCQTVIQQIKRQYPGVRSVWDKLTDDDELGY